MEQCFQSFAQYLYEASVRLLNFDELAAKLEIVQEMLFADDSGIRTRFTSGEVIQIRDVLRTESYSDLKHRDLNIIFGRHKTARLTPAQLRVIANALIYKYTDIEDEKRACAAARAAKLATHVAMSEVPSMVTGASQSQSEVKPPAAQNKKRPSRMVDPLIQAEIEERKAASLARLAKAKAELEARKRLP